MGPDVGSDTDMQTYGVWGGPWGGVGSYRGCGDAWDSAVPSLPLPALSPHAPHLGVPLSPRCPHAVFPPPSPSPPPHFPPPQAQLAFLQGERKGQENLKTDLVRRIKMLEFALKQERCWGGGGLGSYKRGGGHWGTPHFTSPPPLQVEVP